MSYHICFDGLNRDICTLTAWMLSLNGVEYLKSYDTLRENMHELLQTQTGELLLSIAVRLRIIRDKTKNKPSKYQSMSCGEIGIVFERYKEQDFEHITSALHRPLEFENALDKVLHAMIEVKRSKQISEVIKFIITLSGTGKDKDEWEAELDILSFCQVALGFINDKNDTIKLVWYSN